MDCGASGKEYEDVECGDSGKSMEFLDRLKSDGLLDDVGYRVLMFAQAHEPEAVYRMALEYPCLSQWLDFPRVTTAVQRGLVPAATRAALDLVHAARTHPAPTRGVPTRPGARIQPGYAISLDALRVAEVAEIRSQARRDVHASGMPWPVRDQWRRGTCVAHALVACCEHLGGLVGAYADLSEQYLFARCKQSDGAAQADGTWIDTARDIVAGDGVCAEEHLRYNPEPISGDIGQAGSITPQAVATARAQATQAFKYAAFNAPPASGACRVVLDGLDAGRVVALAVPVFKDPISNVTNWTDSSAWEHGEVRNPLPSMVADGGHAVAVTGFEPDASAGCGGGWFIFRNSWGEEWAERGGQPGLGRSPARGYGYLSAYYVETYAWEVCYL